MRKVRLVKLRILGCFLILLGLFLAVGSWFFANKKRRIELTGATTFAKFVKERHETDIRGADYHYIEIEYTLENGKSVQQEMQVPEDIISKAIRDGELEIKYNPENPTEIVFVDFPYTTEDRYTWATILVLLGAGLSVYAFMRKMPEENRQENQP
jgi:hypothetical protein